MRYTDGPTVEATVQVAAPPQRVWELVSDIHLIASLSTEVQEVGWLDGVEAAAPGATFRGRNLHSAVGEWTTTCYVVECVAPRVFAWAMEDVVHPSASWRFELTAAGGGTQLRQWARIGPGPSLLSRAIEARPDKEERIVAGWLRELQAGIDATLAALAELAERR